jgi:hypothetical protein
MPRMPINLPAERDTTRPPLKPFLLLALTLSVLAFCTVLLSR